MRSQHTSCRLRVYPRRPFTERGEGHTQTLLQVPHQPARIKERACIPAGAARLRGGSWPAGACTPGMPDCLAPEVQPPVMTLPDEPGGYVLVVAAAASGNRYVTVT
jgi:hypothetical protein